MTDRKQYHADYNRKKRKAVDRTEYYRKYNASKRKTTPSYIKRESEYVINQPKLENQNQTNDKTGSDLQHKESKS